MQPIVISYLRFSLAEQIKGDSQRRQLELSEKWAAANGLKITERLSDLGVSAFKGRNATEGSLADFLRLVEAGKIPKGSYLLVEELDRLSRQAIEESLAMFLAIIRAGVILVTLNTGDRFERGKLDTTKLMLAILKFTTANDESEKKSFRLAKAWQEKRKQIGHKPLTGKLPSWLKMVDGEIVTVPEKVAVVQKAYRLALNGHGLGHIARILNAECDPIGRAKHFAKATIALMFKSRSVIGEFQPHTSRAGTIREAVGEPIKGYYPAIISEQDYYAVQNALNARKRIRGPQSQFVNLFAGLLYSGQDGSKMQVNNKGNGRRYVSTAAIEGRTGAAKFCGFPVSAFEKAMLFRLSDPSMFVSSDSRAKDTAREIESLNGRIAEVDAKIEAANQALLNGSASRTTSVVSVLTALDVKRAGLMNQLDEAKGQAAGGNRSEDARAAMELLRSALKGQLTNEQRVRIRAAFHTLINRIGCYFERDGRDYYAVTRVELKNGNVVDISFRAENVEHGTRDKEPTWTVDVQLERAG